MGEKISNPEGRHCQHYYSKKGSRNYTPEEDSTTNPIDKSESCGGRKKIIKNRQKHSDNAGNSYRSHERL